VAGPSGLTAPVVTALLAVEFPLVGASAIANGSWILPMALAFNPNKAVYKGAKVRLASGSRTGQSAGNDGNQPGITASRGSSR